MATDIDNNVERMLEEAFHNGKDISLLVEDVQDIHFWKAIFTAFVPHLKLDFPYLNSKGTTGKGELLKYKQYVSKQFVICRDSDNEYLYGKDDTFNVPFIYHTYVYNIENHFCYINVLNTICYEITETAFDVSKLIKTYAKIVYEILAYLVYFKQNNIYHLANNFSWNEYKKSEIGTVLSIKNEINLVKSLDDFEDCFDNLQQKVNCFLQEIKQEIASESWLETFYESIETVKRQLEKDYQITPDKTCFYLTGHIVFPEVILPFMEKVIALLQSQQELEINKMYATATEKILTEKQAAYQNRVKSKDLKTLLLEGYKNCFWQCDCDFMQKIRLKITTEL